MKFRMRSNYKFASCIHQEGGSFSLVLCGSELTSNLYLDYGNTQLTNQIPSLAVTIFVSYLFRGNYFAALRHFSYAYRPWQPRLQFERRLACGRQMELLERFFLTKNQVAHS